MCQGPGSYTLFPNQDLETGSAIVDMVVAGSTTSRVFNGVCHWTTRDGHWAVPSGQIIVYDDAENDRYLVSAYVGVRNPLVPNPMPLSEQVSMWLDWAADTSLTITFQ